MCMHVYVCTDIYTCMCVALSLLVHVNVYMYTCLYAGLPLLVCVLLPIAGLSQETIKTNANISSGESLFTNWQNNNIFLATMI